MPPHDGQVAVYTGSFDPITLGHLDVIERASRIFDHIVVGVGINPDKQPLFDQEERVKLVEAAVGHLNNVTVRRFHGLSVTFVREQKAQVVLRGVRSLTDIEAEFTMTLANRMLDPGIETVFPNGRRPILSYLFVATEANYSPRKRHCVEEIRTSCSGQRTSGKTC